MPNTRRIAATVAVFLMTLVPAFAAAQKDSPAEEKRIMSYKLTVENVRKAADATAKAKAAGVKDDGSGTKSLDEAIRALDADPKLKPIFAAAGISAKDYWMTVNALLHASMAGALPPEAVPAEAQPNIAFLKANQKELEPLVKIIFDQSK